MSNHFLRTPFKDLLPSALMTLEAGDVSQVLESLLGGAATGTGDSGALRTGDHICGVFREVTALLDRNGDDEVLHVDE